MESGKQQAAIQSGGIIMNQEKIKHLAEKIIQLDIKRDELYEELIVVSGGRASEILRFVQNH